MPVGIYNKTLEEKIAARDEYYNQFPKFIVVRINHTYSPLQMMMMSCIEAELCSGQLIQETLGVTQSTIFANINKLFKLKAIQGYKGLYWPTSMSVKDMKIKSKNFWRSTNNPGGKRIRGLRMRTDHEKQNDKFLAMARKNKKWRKPKPSDQLSGPQVSGVLTKQNRAWSSLLW